MDIVAFNLELFTPDRKKYTELPLLPTNCAAVKRRQFKAFQMGWKSDRRVHLKPDMAENWLDLQMKLHEFLQFEMISVTLGGTHRLVQMTEWWTSEKSFEISGDSAPVDISRSDCSTIFLSRASLKSDPTVHTVHLLALFYIQSKTIGKL